MKINDIDQNIQEKLRSHLNQAFMSRRQRNEMYSLRAFARSVNIDPGHLSRLMRGERPISKKMATKIIEELGLTLQQLNKMAKTGKKFSSRKKLSFYEFQPLSKWYYFAILELFYLRDFVSCPKWMSQRLGVELSELKTALKVLQEKGLIKFENGQWTSLNISTDWFDSDETEISKMKHQQDTLRRAINSIDRVRFDKRENAALTIALNSKDIPWLKEKVESFLAEIKEHVVQEDECDQVYQFNVACFPLTSDVEEIKQERIQS